MENDFLKKIDPDRLFLRESMPKTIFSNIKKVLRELNTNKILVTHVKDALDVACLQISEGIKDSTVQNYQMKLNKPFLLPMKENHCFIIGCMPFEFCKDNISINCYFTEDEEIIHLFCNTVMNDLFVNIYARALLVELGIE